MSKSDQKYVKLYFKKVPPKTGYFIDHVHEVPKEKANEYIKNGYCTQPTEVLPKDFPFREELIAGGVETLDEVRDAKDLTKIKGIGPASEKEIAEYLKANS